ncbi:MAG: tetratricopeptide repeat protein [candidate division Zixibacteria bacterium]|nr:tetratricopeptide repeat protein [candidate division Zixibacteria bacterium]
MTQRLLLLTLVLVLSIPAMLSAGIADDVEVLIKQRSFDEAVSLLQDKIKKDATYAELYYLLGRTYYARGDYDLAEEQLEECLDRKRKHEMALYYRTLIYIEKEQWDKARKILEKGAERSKKNAGWYHNGLGLLHAARGETNEADLAFRMALIEDPDNTEFQRNLADLSFDQGVYAVAADGYREVVAKDSTDALAFLKLATSLFYQKMFVDALQSANKAIALDSNYLEAYKLSGDIFMLAALSAANSNGSTDKTSQERFRNATWMYQKFLELGGEETAEIAYRMGQAYYFLNGFPQAVEALTKAIELGSDKSAAYNLKAKSYFRMHEFDQAIAAYSEYEEKISGGDPNYHWSKDDFEFFKERATTLYQLYHEGRREGNADSTLLQQAIPSYLKAIELKPDDPLVPKLYVELGLSYYYYGQYTEAIPWLEKKIAVEPDVYNTYLNLAYCYLKLDSHETAIEMMKKVIELNPQHCPAYKTIATTYLFTMKEKAAASEWLKKWADCDTIAYEPYKWLGYIAISNKPPEKRAAIKYLLTCIKKMEAAGINICDEIDVITWLAQTYNMYDDSDMEDQALIWAKRGLKCDPNNKTLKQIVEELE